MEVNDTFEALTALLGVQRRNKADKTSVLVAALREIQVLRREVEALRRERAEARNEARAQAARYSTRSARRLRTPAAAA